VTCRALADAALGKGAMRTSGAGREIWMTAIPISITLLYLMVFAGGPKELLKAAERQLRATVEWTSQQVW
jgi:hypothetical protein